MSKEIFTILCLFVLLALTVTLVVAHRNKENHILKTVEKMLITAIFLTFVHCMAINVENEVLSTFFMALQQICFTWLSYYVFEVSFDYRGKYEKKSIYIKGGTLALAIIDSVLLFVSSLFFDVINFESYMEDGVRYVRTIPSPYIIIHFICCCIFVIAAIVSLIYKILGMSKLYKASYIISLVFDCLVFLSLIVRAVAETKVDYLIFVYSLVTIVFYYINVIFASHWYMMLIINESIGQLDEAVIIFDREGQYVFSNHEGKELFPLVDNVTDYVMFNKLIQVANIDEFENDFDKNFEYKDKGKSKILRCRFRRISDEKKQLLCMVFVLNDDTEIVTRAKEREYLAIHDLATGLYNKQYFCEVARKMIDENPETEFQLICTNINKFKLINDNFGKEAGDKILKVVCDTLKKIASRDERSVYGRVVNDKFAILIPKSVDVTDELLHMHQITVHVGDVSCTAMNYFGIYDITERNLQIDIMCDRAAMSISEIKGSEKAIVNFDENLKLRLLREKDLKDSINEAIEFNQFKVYYQPQIDYATGEIIGAEALVRWERPNEGLVKPSEFVPLFERDGQITILDRYVWRTACANLAEWKKRGITDVVISVNLSMKDFYSNDVEQYFKNLVSTYGIDPSRLKLEITESAFVIDLEKHISVVRNLQKAGFIIEMDDFGSGYSSLNALKDIPFDVIKMDMAFAQSLRDEKRAKKIVQMVSSLAHFLEVPVIVEGVESEEQAEFFKMLGCTYIQGHYFYEAMSKEQFEEKMADMKFKTKL